MDRFKVPSITKKSVTYDEADLPIFHFDQVVFTEKVGRGSFGTVEKARYKTGRENEIERVVVIKQPYDVLGQEREFIKEARLLNRVNGHRNIVSFYGICRKPYSIMQEYVSFSFAPFGDETVISSFSQFPSHVNEYYDFKGFEHIPVNIMNDLTCGLAYLHQQYIVHRDLKPANVLISNQHMISGSNEAFLRQWQVEESPVICKLADFGESRSKIVQTQTLLTSKVTSLNRGTPAYMAPEILLEEKKPAYATISELMEADIWALGMILFTVTNPSLPYSIELSNEIEAAPMKDHRKIFEEFIRKGQRPAVSQKYLPKHASDWWVVAELCERVTNFDNNKRVNSITAVQDEIEILNSNPPCIVSNLCVHQGSAIEKRHHEMAKIISEGNPGNIQMSSGVSISVPNDGTNACVFLSLKICDEIISTISEGATMKSIESVASTLSDITTTVINEYPVRLNAIRDANEMYTLLDANILMRDNSDLTYDYTFIEVLPYGEGIFDAISRQRLQGNLEALVAKDENFMSIYICEPCAVSIGKIGDELFLIDTHAVSSKSEGNENGQVRVYQAANQQSCISLCRWLWSRLDGSGVKSNVTQSLSTATWSAKVSINIFLHSCIVSNFDFIGCFKHFIGILI